MHAFAGQGVEVGGQSCHQRFAFTGLHLGNVAAVQGDAADDLHGEVLHPQHTPGRFAADGKGIGQDVVQRFAVGQLLLQGRGLGLQFGVRQSGVFGFQRQHLLGDGIHLFQLSVREAAKEFFNKGHWLHLIQKIRSECTALQRTYQYNLYDTPKRQGRQTCRTIFARFCMNFL